MDLGAGAELGILAADAGDRAGGPPLGRGIRHGRPRPPRPGPGGGHHEPDLRSDGPGPPLLAGGARRQGERYRFRRTDGPESWTVVFSADEILLEPGSTAPVDVEAAGSASALALFLWGRLTAPALKITGDATLLPHWFTLVPPV